MHIIKNINKAFVEKKMFFLVLASMTLTICHAAEDKPISSIKKSERINLQSGKFKRIFKACFKNSINLGGVKLLIQAPLTMNMLNPDNLNFLTFMSWCTVDNQGEIIKVSALGISTFDYTKEMIDGTEYYTKVKINFLNKQSKKTVNTVILELKYTTESNPVAQKLIISNDYYQSGNAVYSRERAICPATGKMQECFKLKTSNFSWYSFDVEDGKYLDRYIYNKVGDKMLVIMFKRLQKIGLEYKLLEDQQNGKTTKYEYFDDKVNDGKYYGKIKNIIYPDKSEKYYTYFSDGIIKSVKEYKKKKYTPKSFFSDSF